MSKAFWAGIAFTVGFVLGVIAAWSMLENEHADGQRRHDIENGVVPP